MIHCNVSVAADCPLGSAEALVSESRDPHYRRVRTDEPPQACVRHLRRRAATPKDVVNGSGGAKSYAAKCESDPDSTFRSTCERARRCPPDQIQPPRQVGNRHPDGGSSTLVGCGVIRLVASHGGSKRTVERSHRGHSHSPVVAEYGCPATPENSTCQQKTLRRARLPKGAETSGNPGLSGLHAELDDFTRPTTAKVVHTRPKSTAYAAAKGTLYFGVPPSGRESPTTLIPPDHCAPHDFWSRAAHPCPFGSGVETRLRGDAGNIVASDGETIVRC